MEIIHFGSLSKFYLLIFSFPILYVVRDYCFRELYMDGYDVLYHPLRVTLWMFISELIAFIFEFFLSKQKEKEPATESRVSSDRQNEKDGYSISPFVHNYTSNLSEDKRRFLAYILIGINTLIDFIGFTVLTMLCLVHEANHDFVTEMRISHIFFICLLAFIFLKLKMHRHQNFAICLIFLGFIIIIIPSIIKNKNNVGVMDFVAFILVHLFYSLKQIIDSFLINSFEISPYYLLGMQGVMGIGITLFVTIFCCFITCGHPKICKEGSKYETFYGLIVPDISSDLQFKYHLWTIIFLIVSGLMNVILMVVKAIYTPNHRSICDGLNALFVWLFSLINGNKELYDSDFGLSSFANLIGFSIILFGTLVFNETIVFSICNMNKEVKSEIYRREKAELNLIQQDMMDLDNCDASYLARIKRGEE